jgi:KipI family sensor histidine kinase inhibitor
VVPAGSVGIANNQTGVYPIDSPGGWQLIGRTPVRLYDPTESPPILLKAGNYLRFKRISETEFQEIAGRYKD